MFDFITMNSIKKNYAFVLKSIKKNKTLKPVVENLKGKTYIVSGASRGIGFNIAKKLALQGANVTIVGKTVEKHPKLEGTVFSAAEEICNLVKKPSCIGIPCDIRVSNQMDRVINETLDVYGSIDGVVLNASALCLNNTLKQTEKEIHLMSGVNINGTYLFGQKCLQHMHKNSKGHIIIIAPPVDMLYNDQWWVNHFYYSMSKFNMTLMAKYWNKEFKNIGINTLWPRTTINTAPVRNLLGGDAMVNISRTPDIMGDAANHIFKSDPAICNGNNFIDDEVIASVNGDIEQYRVNKDIKEKDLMPDFFC
jgi:citronellol/citronellal dehydrogenase